MSALEPLTNMSEAARFRDENAGLDLLAPCARLDLIDGLAPAGISRPQADYNDEIYIHKIHDTGRHELDRLGFWARPASYDMERDELEVTLTNSQIAMEDDRLRQQDEAAQNLSAPTIPGDQPVDRNAPAVAEMVREQAEIPEDLDVMDQFLKWPEEQQTDGDTSVGLREDEQGGQKTPATDATTRDDVAEAQMKSTPTLVRPEAQTEEMPASPQPEPHPYAQIGNVIRDVVNRKRKDDGEEEPAQPKKRKKIPIAQEGVASLKGRARKIHEKTTALELAQLDPARELGIFRENGRLVLKVAGLEEPAEDAPKQQWTRFESALAAAILETQLQHPFESWYRPMVRRINQYLGHEPLTAGLEQPTFQELLAGASCEETTDDDPLSEDEEQEINADNDDRKSLKVARGNLASNYLKQTNLLGTGRRVCTPRGSGKQADLDAVIQAGTELQQKKPRKNDKALYPTLPDDHPNRKKEFTRKQIESIIWQYPVEKNKRHQIAPNYFNNRGYLYQRGVGSEIIKEWVQRFESIAVSANEGGAEWPKDMFPISTMINCLARYNQTVAHISAQGLLNSRGQLRKAPVRKTEDGRDDVTGKYIRTSDMPGGVRALSDVGRREAVSIALEKGDKKTGERTDVTRAALESSVKKFVDAQRLQDVKMEAVIKALHEGRLSAPDQTPYTSDARLWLCRLEHMGLRTQAMMEEAQYLDGYVRTMREEDDKIYIENQRLRARLSWCFERLCPETTTTQAAVRDEEETLRKRAEQYALWTLDLDDLLDADIETTRQPPMVGNDFLARDSAEAAQLGAFDYFLGDEDFSSSESDSDLEDEDVFVSRAEAAELTWEAYEFAQQHDQAYERNWKMVWSDDGASKKKKKKQADAEFKIVEWHEMRGVRPPAGCEKGELF